MSRMVSSHEPVRGSDVELWIRQARDTYDQQDPRQQIEWTALDALLDDYRERADTSTPLLASPAVCGTCAGRGCPECTCPQCPHSSNNHPLFALGDTWADGGVEVCGEKGCLCVRLWSATDTKPTMPSDRDLDLYRDLVWEDDGS